MLKPLHKSDIQTSPFIATKDWNLSNTINDWVVLTEHSGGLPVALEYEEHLPTTASINSDCNVALEQQPNDRVRFREGLKSSGLFYPETDDVNADGTYKRLVYSQVQNMFYNKFRDPTKIWGLEYLDFENSKTKRFLSNKFLMYDIPTDIFGEKIVENTIFIYNQTIDDEYTIVDDGRNNLFLVSNLFSKKQELGDFANEFTGSTDPFCDAYFGYFDPYIERTISESLSDINVGLFRGGLDPTIIPISESMASINVGLSVGSIENVPESNTISDFGLGIYTGSLLTVMITVSTVESASVDNAFYEGALTNTIITASVNESASVDNAFYTGSLITLMITGSNNESASVDNTFFSGSVTEVVTEAPPQSEPVPIIIGLSSGSLNG